MSMSRLLKAGLLVISFSVLNSQVIAQEVDVIDLTMLNPDIEVPLPPGVQSMPFDVTTGGLGPNAAAAEVQALLNTAKAVVEAARFLAWLNGVDVTVEIRISEKVGPTTEQSDGQFHSKWRMSGRFIWLPAPPGPPAPGEAP